jgi:septal ring factor EnvC (AmiA/AmiB activator)
MIKKNIGHTLVLFVCLIFFASPCQAKPIETEDPQKINASIKKLKSSINQLENKLSFQQEHASKHIKTVSKIETDIGKNAEQLRQLKERLQNKNQHIILLSQNIHSLKANHHSQEAHLKEQLLNKFKTYKTERWKLIFNQPPRNEHARLTKYYDFFDEARIEYIYDLVNKLQFLFAQERLLTKESTLLTRLKVNHDQKANMLKTEYSDRAKELDKLQLEMSKNKNQLSALKQQEKDLGNLFKQLQKRIQSAGKFASPKDSKFPKMLGKLHSPLKLSGLAFVPGKNLFLAASEGTEVFSVFPGRVVFAQWLKGLGLLLIIDHGSGYMSLYGNNQILYKTAGDWINAGEMIARVGVSGGRKDPGLYFEIRKDGKPLDAHRWFLQG